MKLLKPLLKKNPFHFGSWKVPLLILCSFFVGLTWGQVNTGGTATTSNHQKQVIGYITNWDAWKAASAGVPSAGALTQLNIDYSKYTILNYSFFGVAVDGSLHSGDLRNKNIYQPGAIQEPGDILFTDIYSSWDMYLLFGELEVIQYISPDVKERAEAYGFEVEVGGATWNHPGWGLSGQLPLPLPKEGGAKGLLELAKENGVKVMASIGGWSMCKHFPEMAADPVKKARFIEDCKRLINMGFDGIDLDWEYPGPYPGMNFTGTNADYPNFASLVEEIRAAIGPDKLITAAMSADPKKLEGFDWNRLDNSMDYFNMMTYDFNGGWSNIAGHNAPVYPYDGAEVPDFNWQSTLTAMQSMGVPSNKINFGIPFYGRGVVTDGNATLNAPTVKRNVTIQPDGPVSTAADYTNWPQDVYDGTPNHFFIKQKTEGGNGWTKKWDDQAKVPYMTKGNFFLSYDDEESIGIKAQYINDNNLAGTIVWTVFGDLEISGSFQSFGTKLKRWSNVKSPLINKVNEVFANGGDPDPNTAPSVAISSPLDNANFEEGNAITIEANANDIDGTVTKVEFYVGTQKIGEDISSPYQVVWNGANEGSYSLTAKAYDNDNANTTSSSISIFVSGGDCSDSQNNFKVVGYMPSWQGSANTIQYDKLTHINYSFLLPNSDGSLQPLDNVAKMQQIVSLGHAQGVKVLIAVGGWMDGNDSPFSTLAANPTTRTTFIDNLVNYVNQYNLDGVDMDWEYPREGNEPQNFELLMQELGQAMHSRGKLLTSAVVVSGWNADGILSGVFDDVDFLNIMAYDGPDHGAMTQAQGGLDYWLGRGLPKEKAVLGVPFYSRPQAQSYASLLAQGASPNSDSFQGNNYNGIPTIKAKTEMALNRAGGIMIWELSHDTTDQQTSLLAAINQVVGDPCDPGNIKPVVSITSPTNNANIELGTINLTATASDQDGTISSVVFTIAGKDISATASDNIYSASWIPDSEGPYTIVVTATDNDNASTTNQVSVTVTSGDTGGCTAPPYVNGQVYVGGDTVSYQGNEYRAKWWTQNNDPVTNRENVWELLGPCTDENNPDGGVIAGGPFVFTVGDGIADNVSGITLSGNSGMNSQWVITDEQGKILGLPVSPEQVNFDGSGPGICLIWHLSYEDGLTGLSADNNTSGLQGAFDFSNSITVTRNSVGDNNPEGGVIAGGPFVFTVGDGIADNVSGITLSGNSGMNSQWVITDEQGKILGLPASPEQVNFDGAGVGICLIWHLSYENGLIGLSADNNVSGLQGSFDFSNSISVTRNAVGGGDCTEPQYVENGGYVAGSQVENAGNLYECKPYPFSGWCNGAAWAYAPGEGTYWQDAWTLIGECGDGDTGGNEAPTVSITQPANGQSFTAGSTITINASASDSDGNVTKVEFLRNGTIIGEDTTSPYSFTWNNASTGNYILTTRATDDDNATGEATVNISVGSVPPPPPGGDLPKRILVGYWHNFNNGSSIPKLRDISDKWDVINISFAIPTVQNGATMTFTPDPEIYSNAQEFKNDVALLQSRGKKVLISMGGATGAVDVDSPADAQAFSSSMTSIINEYGFDGMDIDFEGTSISLAPGDTSLSNPTSPKVVNLITAFRSILSQYDMSKFILSMAPETAYVQGAIGQYGGIWGAYLPLIYALRTEMDYIHVQHYNTGSMLGLDGKAYSAGNADFHVAMAEVLLQGFTLSTGEQFPALRPDQVAIGLPASPSAAGSGYTPATEVHKALDYIIKGQSFGGQYTLRNPSGYANFRGLMTWSINWDIVAGFGFSDPHRTYLDALDQRSPEQELLEKESLKMYPNPFTSEVTITFKLGKDKLVNAVIYNQIGVKIAVLKDNERLSSGSQNIQWDTDGIPSGIYFLKLRIGKEVKTMKLIKQ
ncbi:T9SS type A sorting domain-containing protein [Aquimarina sp. MMG015]|uniref:glycosyl hydrolase family 18 protein n=1 Tax=Aquimarina sp. MMG015 TaxID=2822689 RepID=UPI001B39D048|nr:glycosyl hydrolase family 18 protein [Aquimarina sp. MMG015]MBQ4801856.1 T9SS type A sorting domain-containing protein [Aquimarina sp. MMG015]